MKAALDIWAGARRKVVLYNPKAVFFTMPLALLAIGSALDPKKYDVIVIDGRLEADAESAVLAQLSGSVCLGITVLTGSPISDALLISRAAKRAHPNMPIVWGGWHPSLFGRDCLAEASVDVTVQGQGEDTFAEIVDRLAKGLPLQGCLGCAVRLHDGRIVMNPPRSMRPLDEYRAHDYRMIQVERYYELKGKRQLDFISSQGCNFRCAFCSDPFVYGRKWVGLDPSTMVTRLQELYDLYHFDDVNFQDETFFTQRDRVLLMADGIIELGMQFTWAATMRADQGVRLPDHVWARCKQSGLRRLLVGVESGSDAMLKRIRKDIRIDQVFATAERMIKHRIAGHFPFIVGFPEESDDSIRETLSCAKRLRAMSPEFFTPIFYFKPYPGSQIVTEAVANGFQLPDTLAAWSTFDFVDGLPGPWVSREKYRLIERFKFFQDLAWKRRTPANALLQRLARYRCGRDNYRWPLEMVLMRLGRSQPRLS